MSEANGKVCCNCRHCIRYRNADGLVTYCVCEMTKKYLHYEQVMEGWCRHWAKEKKEGESE